MKITLSKIYIAVLFFAMTSCVRNTSDSQFDPNKTKSVFAAIKDTNTYFEGRLEKVEKIAANEYYF